MKTLAYGLFWVLLATLFIFSALLFSSAGEVPVQDTIVMGLAGYPAILMSIWMATACIAIAEEE